ncbi:MAG: type II secretion system protein [Candidatus Absconditicoccaceae bacterium]
MKNFKKGFTLVEMLIVVVIIGILAAALLPRLMSAQASARDSARMSAIQQIATATAAYLQETGNYPTSGASTKGSTDDLLAKLVENGNVASLPQESKKNISNDAIEGAPLVGKYGYAVLKKNGIANGAIVFVAKVERAGNANYVLDTSKKIGSTDIDDATKLYLCKTVTKGSLTPASPTTQDCKYADESQLYYVGVY